MYLLCTNPNSDSNILDFSVKLATILIAGANLYFAIFVFKRNDKKNDAEKERDRKIQLLKTLFLDQTLSLFYEQFDNLERELKELTKSNSNTIAKQNVENKIADIFILLRRNFYGPFIAIDILLYNNIKDECDTLQGNLSESIFDPGVNLSHIPKFNELILEKLNDSKIKILEILFTYRGI